MAGRLFAAPADHAVEKHDHLVLRTRGAQPSSSTTTGSSAACGCTTTTVTRGPACHPQVLDRGFTLRHVTALVDRRPAHRPQGPPPRPVRLPRHRQLDGRRDLLETPRPTPPPRPARPTPPTCGASPARSPAAPSVTSPTRMPPTARYAQKASPRAATSTSCHPAPGSSSTAGSPVVPARAADPRWPEPPSPPEPPLGAPTCQPPGGAHH